MPGIRLHHAVLRNCVLVCPSDEISRGPHLCSLCNEVHIVRTRHLRLDEYGDVIVSPVIFRRMKRAGLHNYGLTIANEVKRPPTQTISLNVPPAPIQIIRSPGPEARTPRDRGDFRTDG